MFGWTDDETHCFVRRQPENADEIDGAVRALWSSEVDCIRYRGTDPALLKRIAELGGADRCDVDQGRVRMRIRDRVLLRSRLGEADSATALADRFRSYLAEADRPWPYRLRPRRRWRPARVIFSWDSGITGKGHFNSVTFAVCGEGKGRFLARLAAWSPAATGLALLVHDWLKEAEAAEEVRWFSLDELDSGKPGFHMPI
jgi:hypothetical protein